MLAALGTHGYHDDTTQNDHRLGIKDPVLLCECVPHSSDEFVKGLEFKVLIDLIACLSLHDLWKFRDFVEKNSSQISAGNAVSTVPSLRLCVKPPRHPWSEWSHGPLSYVLLNTCHAEALTRDTFVACPWSLD